METSDQKVKKHRHNRAVMADKKIVEELTASVVKARAKRTKKNGDESVAMAASMTAKEKQVTIKPLRLGVIAFKIKGTAPLLMARFSEKARAKMMGDMEAGQSSRSKRVREPRDFAADAKAALHVFEGTTDPGIPASAFRSAMISACRTVGFKMTVAKLCFSALADGLSSEGTPLVRVSGSWDMNVAPVRNSNGSTDLRARPLFKQWSAVVRIRFDMDLFSPDDIANLFIRAGAQVGVLEGRPDSRQSAGLGYGTFEVEGIGQKS